MSKTTREQYEEAYRLARINNKGYDKAIQDALFAHPFSIIARRHADIKRQQDTMLQRNSRRNTGLVMTDIQSRNGVSFFNGEWE